MKNKARRRYAIYGKAGLESGEEWHSPTNALDRFFTVGALPSGPKQGEASCAGLAPDGVYVYAEWGEGRANRPPCTGSTVAPTVTARWKARTCAHTEWPKLVSKDSVTRIVV